jgi:hypothetical protein
MIVINKNNNIDYFVLGVNCEDKILLIEVNEELRSNRLRISKEEFVNNYILPDINRCVEFIYERNFQYNFGKRV